MQMIAGQNVRPNSRPGPIGFGFGSGHNPTAAATMMNRSGPAPTTSKARPTFTHTDLRYWRIAKCGLTVRLSGRVQTRPARGERTIAKRARGAPPPTYHGRLQQRARPRHRTPLALKSGFSITLNRLPNRSLTAAP